MIPGRGTLTEAVQQCLSGSPPAQRGEGLVGKQGPENTDEFSCYADGEKRVSQRDCQQLRKSPSPMQLHREQTT